MPPPSHTDQSLPPTAEIVEVFEPAMRRALELARRGEGRVEPNPMVGAVVVAEDGTRLAEGWHDRFGGAHAEVMAIEAAGEAARGATLVVTLEPCSHTGKTPPCTGAIERAGIRRVVVGCRDPNPAAAGGLELLHKAGVEVVAGLLETEARQLIAPFATLVAAGRPWVIAKWAMTLDGRIATASGESQWISSESSREIVHALRGRVDAILVGIGTALTDDPLLTARPPGPRQPLRVVLDSTARLPLESNLVRTARETPLLVAVGPEADPSRESALAAAGCEIWKSPQAGRQGLLVGLLAELARREVTNLLVEGGATVLGGLLDARLIDEVWCFIAATLVGGEAPAAIGGRGISRLAEAARLEVTSIERPGGDLLVRCRRVD